MRTARLILNILAFCAAASGSIWIGWIYAGSQLNAGKPPAVAVVPTPEVLRQAKSDAIGRFQDFGPPPDLGSLNPLPGLPGAVGDASELNGFPTISKDAIERAAGYSDGSLPEVETPFSIGPGDLKGGESTP